VGGERFFCVLHGECCRGRAGVAGGSGEGGFFGVGRAVGVDEGLWGGGEASSVLGTLGESRESVLGFYGTRTE